MCLAVATASARVHTEKHKTHPREQAEGTTSYQSLHFEANSVEGGAPKQSGERKPMVLKGAVSLTLIPDDASQKPLVMHADTATMKFGAKGGTAPETMELDGKVSVNGEMGNVTAQKAVMRMKSHDVLFTGNVVFDSSDYGKGQCGSLQINMDTGEFKMTGHSTGTVPIGQDNATGERKTTDPSLLRETDIRDWTGLIRAIQKQDKSEAASPGRRMMSILSATARDRFAQIPSGKIAQSMKGPILEQLNGVIRNRRLYDAKAWHGVTLTEETKRLLRRRSSLEPSEICRLNRLLLDAAYPSFIARAKKPS